MRTAGARYPSRVHERVRRLFSAGLLVLTSCSPPPPTGPESTPPDEPTPLGELPTERQYRGGPTRTGDLGSPASLEHARPAWTVRALDATPITGAPLVAGPLVAFGTQAGSVYAVDARTGDRRWSVEVGPRVQPPVLFGSEIVVGHEAGLTGLDPDTGATRWERTGPAVRGAPAFSDGRAYLSTSKSVTALDWPSRRERWRIPLDSGSMSSPATDGTNVFVGVNQRSLLAIDAATGDEHWRERVGGRVAATPIVAEQLVVCGVLGRDDPKQPIDGVRAYDKDAGTLAWSVRTRASVSGPMAYADDTVFFASHAPRVGAIDVKSGEVRWTFSPRGARTAGAASSGPVVGSRTVAVVVGRTLYVLDRNDGTLLSKAPVDTPVSGPIGGDAQLLAWGTHAGAVHAFTLAP